jgi:hypothetical protein
MTKLKTLALIVLGIIVALDHGPALLKWLFDSEIPGMVILAFYALLALGGLCAVLVPKRWRGPAPKIWIRGLEP